MRIVTATLALGLLVGCPSRDTMKRLAHDDLVRSILVVHLTPDLLPTPTLFISTYGIKTTEVARLCPVCGSYTQLEAAYAYTCVELRIMHMHWHCTICDAYFATRLASRDQRVIQPGTP